MSDFPIRQEDLEVGDSSTRALEDAKVNLFAHKYLLSTYYVASIVLGTGDTAMNQTKIPALGERGKQASEMYQAVLVLRSRADMLVLGML